MESDPQHTPTCTYRHHKYPMAYLEPRLVLPSPLHFFHFSFSCTPSLFCCLSLIFFLVMASLSLLLLLSPHPLFSAVYLNKMQGTHESQAFFLLLLLSNRVNKESTLPAASSKAPVIGQQNALGGKIICYESRRLELESLTPLEKSHMTALA